MQITQSVGATRIALVIIALAAVAFLSFRLCNIDTLNTTTAAIESTSPSTQPERLASQETTPAP